MNEKQSTDLVDLETYSMAFVLYGELPIMTTSLLVT